MDPSGAVMVVRYWRSSGLWVAPLHPQVPFIPMIFPRSIPLLKGAVLTAAGIATIYSGSASANPCVFNALSSCNVSLPNFTISSVSYVGRFPNDGGTTSLGGFPTNATVTFTEAIGSNGKPTLEVLVAQTGIQGLLRAADFNFTASTVDPTLVINGFNGVTTTLISSTTQPRGGTFNVNYNSGQYTQSGTFYNSLALASNPSLVNSGPITNGTTTMGPLFQTVAIALGYDNTGIGATNNRPNSLTGVFTTDVPLPLPVVGAGFAFGFTRKLRQRAKSVA
jgi:hypothetical protein